MWNGKWVGLFGLAGVLILMGASLALAQMGPVENRIEEGKGDGPQIEMQVRVFSMSRAQIKAFVARYAKKAGLVPVDVLDAALKGSLSEMLDTLDGPQGEALWRALEETPKLNLVVSPTVKAASGTKASMYIGRQFRYPKKWSFKSGDEPEFVPSDYQTRLLGLSFEAVPTSVASGGLIHLDLFCELSSLFEYHKFRGQGEIEVNDETDFEELNRIAKPYFSLRYIKMSSAVPNGKILWFRLPKGNAKSDKQQEFEFLLLKVGVVGAK